MNKKNKAAVELGKRGGKKTAEKYPTEIRRLWGKKGGRPKKKEQKRLLKPVDIAVDKS